MEVSWLASTPVRVLQRLSVVVAMLLAGGFATAIAAERTPDGSVRVGIIVPLTGPLSEFGEAIRNGITLALEERPGAAQMVTPFYEDSRYDSATAVAAFQKLFSVDRVDLAYVFGGPMSSSLAPVAEAQRQPMFSTEYSPELTRGREFVTRFANTSHDFAATLLTELRARGYKKLGVVKCENQYHNTLFEALQSLLHADERIVLIANHLPGDQDFRATITKLRSEPFDVLGLYLLPGMQNAFLKQLQTQGISYPLFGTDTFETDGENRGVERVARGALYVNAAVSEDFVARYRARFGNVSQIVHAALGYEFTMLLLDRYNPAALSMNPKEIVSALRFAETRGSILGNYSFQNNLNEGPHYRFPLLVKKAMVAQ